MNLLTNLRSAWGLAVAALLTPGLGGRADAQSEARPPLKVHLIGAGEYNPVESLTEFKKHLEQNYRVEVTTSFGKDGKSLPNLEQLKSAEVMLIFVRRMNLPEEQMAIIRNHWEKGKPIVALRTASHDFQEADIETFSKVIGGSYTGPGSYTAPFKAVAAPAQKDHPVLNGVGSIASRGCYNFKNLAEKAVVVQIVESDKKVKAPVAWVHAHNGGRTFFSTMGVPEDFRDEQFRRLLVNAVFWTGKRDADKERIKP